MTRDVTFTVGNVKVTITPSLSSPCPSSASPEIVTSDKSSDQSKKQVKFRHFSGTMRVSVNAGNATRSVSEHDESAALLQNAEEINRSFLVLNMGNVPKSEQAERMTTPLHISCGSTSPSVAEMQTIFSARPGDAKIQDRSGCLPIHLVAENKNLFDVPGRMKNVDELVTQLLNVYPESVLVTNDKGRIPFTEPILQWIEEMATHQSQQTMPLHAITNFLNEEDDANRIIPTDVQLSPHAAWCIRMLSEVLDRVTSTYTRDKIAENVSSIPSLIKTVLLINNKDTRAEVMNSSIFRRVLLCPSTVDTWILPMLQHSASAARCVDYFELISASKLSHYVGGDRKPIPSDIDSFHRLQHELFEKVGENDSIIPSLKVLPNYDIERAAVTTVIRDMIDKALRHPFVLSMAALDIAFLLLVIYVFRELCFQYSVLATIPKAMEDYKQGKIYPHYKESITVVIVGASYFLIRKITQALAMISISFKVFCVSFFDFWNLFQTAGAVLTVISAVQMLHLHKTHETVEDPQEDNNPKIFAFTIAFLWLSLVQHTRCISKNLATFLVIFNNILRDVMAFFVIMIAAICMFADVAHILTTGKGDCLIPTNEKDQATVSEMYPYDEDNPFCSSDFKDSYLRLYTIVLGDFSLSYYKEDRYKTVVFILFTAMVVIVLMTSLTAVVIDSYQRSKLETKFTYGRVRVAMAAEQVAYIKQLEKGTCESRNWKGLCYMFYRYLVLVKICVVIGITCYGIFSRFTNDMKNQGQDANVQKRKVLSLPLLMIVAAVMIMALIVILDFMFEGCIGNNTVCSPIYRKFHQWKNKIFHSTSTWRKRFAMSEEVDSDEEEQSRLTNLERAMNRIVQESEQRLCELLKDTETRLLKNEAEMKAELEAVIEKLIKENKQLRGDELDSVYEDDTGDEDDDSTQGSIRQFTRSDLGIE